MKPSTSLLFGPIRNRIGVSAILQMALLVSIVTVTKWSSYEREFLVEFACGLLSATAILVLVPTWRGSTWKQRGELLLMMVFPTVVFILFLIYWWTDGR